jgi:hypothetical protein
LCTTAGSCITKAWPSCPITAVSCGSTLEPIADVNAVKVFLPPTLVATFYGMNFAVMPGGWLR